MKKFLVFKLQYFFVFLAMGTTTFMNLYFIRIGFTGTQIGIIGAIGPVISLLVLPFWGLISDGLNARKKILMLTIAVSIFTFLLYPLSKSFYYIILLAIIGSLFPFMPSLDGNTIVGLGTEGSYYGKVRVWGSFGFALSTTLTGFIVQRTQITNIFYLYALFMAATFICCTRMSELKAAKTEKKLSGHLKELLTNKVFLVFLAVIFISQFSVSVSESYFALYMNAIKAKDGVIGAAFTVAGLSEIPVFIYSSKLLKRYGSKKLMVFAMCIYTLKILLYSFVKNPNMVVLIQLLNGISFAPLFAASVNFVNDLAPVQLKSTAQYAYSLVSRSLVGVLGNLIGGRLYDLIGVQAMYRYFSIMVFIALVLLIVFVKEKENNIANVAASA